MLYFIPSLIMGPEIPKRGYLIGIYDGGLRKLKEPFGGVSMKGLLALESLYWVPPSCGNYRNMGTWKSTPLDNNPF